MASEKCSPPHFQQFLVWQDILLAIMACAANIGPKSSRPNASATVRYLRRAVVIERRWEGDLTGHHFWASCLRKRLHYNKLALKREMKHCKNQSTNQIAAARRVWPAHGTGCKLAGAIEARTTVVFRACDSL